METTAQVKPTEVINTLYPPRIGSKWAGGVYAGVIGGQNGQPDYHLIHAPVEADMADLTWADAMKQATLPINGFVDWSLPDRREARLLHINTPAGFDTDGWYWTSTQDAANSVCVWMQYFSDGYQFIIRKSYTFRARAVRRLIIE